MSGATYPHLIREERYGSLTVVANGMLRDMGEEPAVGMCEDDARRWCERNFLVMVTEPVVDSTGISSTYMMRDQTAFRATFRAQGLPPNERTPKSRRKPHPIWRMKRLARRVVGR